jgi:6-pyruvoyltetrahydropterin/6-carboxytetrahydropterin synthase
MMRLEFKSAGFSSAHFVVGHTRCEHLHGHNWEVKVVIEGEPDDRGLVVDFNELAGLLEEMCNRYDHRVLIPSRNRSVAVEQKENRILVRVHRKEYTFPREDVVLIPVDNITVERMAATLLQELVRRISRYPNVRKVGVWVGEKPEEGAWAHADLRAR